jgi:hypothetical protein
LLVFAGAEHEGADGFAGVFAFVEDELHLSGDGHFDVVFPGHAESSVRAEANREQPIGNRTAAENGPSVPGFPRFLDECIGDATGLQQAVLLEPLKRE